MEHSTVHQPTDGGGGNSHSPNNHALPTAASVQTPARPPNAPALLTEADFRQALGGISERKFKQLRAAGVIGAALELGPRLPRWLWADVEAAVQRLPRRSKQSEPQALAQGRRQRIERIKAGA